MTTTIPTQPASSAPAPPTVDLDLFDDLRRFGAADVSACFTCGTCTATCPLSDDAAMFPRQIIRYAEVGLKRELLASKELWVCYHCGECSRSCPTQADPAEFMATARRYAVASYDKTRLARVLYTRPVLGSVVATLLAGIFAAFMYSARGPREASSLDLFRFIPDHLIHWTGIGVMVLMAIAGGIGLVRMARSVAAREQVTLGDLVGGRAALGRTWGAIWSAVGVESLGQRRYRADCKADDEPPEPLYRRRWLIHALTIWGFLGLLVATVSDWGLALLGIKETGTPVPIWYPTRLLGTVAGISLLYGVTMFFLARAQRRTSFETSTASDWLLLVLLWITGASGFVIEAALYLPSAPAWGYWVFLFHVAVAMELMLLLPFTKFAHAVYRPLALFFYSLAKSRPATTNANR